MGALRWKNNCETWLTLRSPCSPSFLVLAPWSLNMAGRELKWQLDFILPRGRERGWSPLEPPPTPTYQLAHSNLYQAHHARNIVQQRVPTLLPLAPVSSLANWAVVNQTSLDNESHWESSVQSVCVYHAICRHIFPSDQMYRVHTFGKELNNYLCWIKYGHIFCHFIEKSLKS